MRDPTTKGSDDSIWPEGIPDEVLRELQGRLESPGPRPEELEESIQARVEYDLGAELGRGGMGTVRVAWDINLQRVVALKVVRRLEPGQPGQVPPAERARLLSRFLREARIAGQLAHPGIVPVHELGRLPDGTVYFTMPVVRGDDLNAVFAWSRQGARGWSVPRALTVIQRVCETLAYAHQRGVIHRDVKPDNVMVGAFGETYVLDWGLAKFVEGASSRESPEMGWIDEELPINPGADAVQTQEGAAMGSASYMAPEQAAGKLSEIGPAADVYAVGALLYTLLAGRRPYQNDGESRTREQVIAAVLAGPPRPLEELAPHQPAELNAIVHKAMAREPSRRYPSMETMAEDLRAFLENRVVRAHRTGAVVELWKWVQRNKTVAALACVTLVSLVGASLWNAEVQAASRKEVLLSGDVSLLPYLVSFADRLWPAVPEMVPDMDVWLSQADALLARTGQHEEQLALLESMAGDREPGGRLVFSAADQGVLHEKEATLVKGLRRLADEVVPGVRSRRAFAATITEKTLTGPAARRLWKEAIDSIRSTEECPQYDGLSIEPQLGLLPAGRDPHSGMWEFVHLQTGEVPNRDAEGRFELSPESALVFVLIPGGGFLMGGQAKSEQEDNYTPFAESPGRVQRVRLDPFFLSKYEVTQAQWIRTTGRNAALYDLASDAAEGDGELLHPVENLTRDEAATTMARLRLVLPTESQWEYAARAGTTTPWWTGDKPESLEGVSNLADRSYAELHETDRAEGWDDGFPVHSPVDAFKPNPLGLYGMLGNVQEYCQDRWSGEMDSPPRPGDGLRSPEGVLAGVLRGGTYSSRVWWATVVERFQASPGTSDPTTGVRPARALE